MGARHDPGCSSSLPHGPTCGTCSCPEDFRFRSLPSRPASVKSMLRVGTAAGRGKGSGGGRPGASSALPLLLGASPRLRRRSITTNSKFRRVAGVQARQAPKGAGRKEALSLGDGRPFACASIGLAAGGRRLCFHAGDELGSAAKRSTKAALCPCN